MARENLLVVLAVNVVEMLLRALAAEESYGPVLERALVLPVSHEELPLARNVDPVHGAHVSVTVRRLGELLAAEDALGLLESVLHM